jgi:hypothetical protein
LLEHGAFVALALLVIWVALLIPLARGTLKAIPFGAASMFLARMIPFFWLGPEITELTILKVGSFKTNGERATKYFDEIKTIRTKIEAEEHAIGAAVASVTALEKQAAELKLALEREQAAHLPRTITPEQQAKLIAPSYTGLERPRDYESRGAGFYRRKILCGTDLGRSDKIWLHNVTACANHARVLLAGSVVSCARHQ